jgi:uncharacterized NAD(P)/FAD-binding protein YdhS
LERDQAVQDLREVQKSNQRLKEENNILNNKYKRIMQMCDKNLQKEVFSDTQFSTIEK